MMDRGLTAGWPDTINPLRLIGFFAFETIRWCGGLGTLSVSMLAAWTRPARSGEMTLHTATFLQMVWLIVWGAPLVVLVHVGQGSFLALQAFHGAIFLDAVGPVVGVGLFRNVGNQLTGLVMCGLMSMHTVAELRLFRSKADRTALKVDRDLAKGIATEQAAFVPDPARLAFARVVGAMLAGPVLGFIGCVAGLVAGLSVSRSILDVPTVWFLYNFMEMLWARDLVGIIVKGVAFSGAVALISCHEGLRRPEGTAEDLGIAIWRSACLGVAAILLLNAAWFTFMFLGGAPFGRTVLEPPVPR